MRQCQVRSYAIGRISTTCSSPWLLCFVPVCAAVQGVSMFFRPTTSRLYASNAPLRASTTWHDPRTAVLGWPQLDSLFRRRVPGATVQTRRREAFGHRITFLFSSLGGFANSHVFKIAPTRLVAPGTHGAHDVGAVSGFCGPWRGGLSTVVVLGVSITIWAKWCQVRPTCIRGHQVGCSRAAYEATQPR